MSSSLPSLHRSFAPMVTLTNSRPQDFEPPSGELAKAIEADFGSVDSLISKFNPKTAAVQVCRHLSSDPHWRAAS